jgi:hypothetical protein
MVLLKLLPSQYSLILRLFFPVPVGLSRSLLKESWKPMMPEEKLKVPDA